MDINNYAELSANVELITNSGIKIIGLSNVNDQLQHYLIYKMVNIINGKYYIGQHKTKNPFDNYTGSGTYIEHAISYYGVSAFIKIIIKDFCSFDEMNMCEKQLVQLSNCYPYDPMSYNLMEGGHGGQLTEVTKEKIRKGVSKAVSGEKNPMYGYQWSEAQRKHQSDVMKGRPVSDKYRESCRQRATGSGNPMFGKHHSLESKQKMSNTRKQRKCSANEKNPMYGLKCLSEQQKIEWKQKISKANSGRKISDAERKQRLINAKKRHAKNMHDPLTGKIICVPKKDIQKFLDLGYVFGTGLKPNLGKIGACAGKRIMTSPDGSKHYIKVEEIPFYVSLGWKQSKRSKPI